jgi:hypothetical protein
VQQRGGGGVCCARTAQGLRQRSDARIGSMGSLGAGRCGVVAETRTEATTEKRPGAIGRVGKGGWWCGWLVRRAFVARIRLMVLLLTA